MAEKYYDKQHAILKEENKENYNPKNETYKYGGNDSKFYSPGFQRKIENKTKDIKNNPMNPKTMKPVDPWEEEERKFREQEKLWQEEDERWRLEEEKRRKKAIENTRKNPQATIERIKAMSDDAMQEHFDVASDRYKDENGIRPHGFLPTVAWDYLVQDLGLEQGTEPYEVAKQRYKEWFKKRFDKDFFTFEDYMNI